MHGGNRVVFALKLKSQLKSFRVRDSKNDGNGHSLGKTSKSLSACGAQIPAGQILILRMQCSVRMKIDIH